MKDSGQDIKHLKRTVVIVVICSIVSALVASIITTSILQAKAPNQENKNAPQQIKGEDYSIPIIAREVTPAVVGISTAHIDRDIFYRPVKSETIGSGIIVNSKGFILTNDHVVRGEGDIKVFLSDGRKYNAKVLFTDPSLDLAVVKINATGLPSAKLGNSDDVLVGDIAIAIGNPLGLTLQRSVTAGIISALRRMVSVEDGQGTVLMQDLIQTDASINPGNSGGPLINSEGKIIGINTIKASQAEAIGFAIPINIAKPIIKSLVEKGRFDVPYLGIEGIDKSIAMLLDMDVPEEGGIYINNVIKKGPAAKANIRQADVITKLAGVPVDSMAKLRQVMYEIGAGQIVDIEIKRKGRRLLKKVRLGTQDSV